MRKIKISVLAIIAISLMMPFIANATALSDIAGNKNQTAIEYLNEHNVISGYPDGTFQPDKIINRAELLKVLVGGKGITPTVQEYNNCFPDVTTEWFAPFVCYAKAQEWVGGYPDGTFKPSKEVNKVEAIKMLVNSQGYKVEEQVSETMFDDADSSAWYAPFIKAAKDKGLLEVDNGNYGVTDSMDRAEISENIYRAMIIVEKNLDKFTAPVVYVVTEVVDGDTIEINNSFKIRFIGVDTPETVDPTKPVQCFGTEASNIAKEKLLNQTVTLESDETQGDKDKYDRLLRYVILGDGTNFNKWLIENGYGHEYTYKKAYKYQKEFKTSEKQAMDSNVGLWADNVCSEENNIIIDDEQTVNEEPTTGYICSSNTYNCTDFSNKSDAQKVYDYCKAQVGTDIHKLDGDNNGLACESL
ncbi:hypothetical protein COY05_02850 [Candidatus Peregrinibacteria bacterium CG_4_10_14_0_2_um_filter_38_24]|nr:MAG: hypothetical protein COY05_02850 [Candidatus Peregrinibacteria bacterium CG_4_10_14_0_2_um_filter_38_24]